MADLQQSSPSEPDAAGSSEEGRTALRVRGGTSPWTFLPLFALVVLAVVWVIAIDTSLRAWIVFGGILVVVVGVTIALNPRRSSPPGGTERR